MVIAYVRNAFIGFLKKTKLFAKRLSIIGIIFCLAGVPGYTNAKSQIQLGLSSQAGSKLSAFIQEVLAKNPAIQAADANVAAAGARHQASDQPLYNPSLIANGQKSSTSSYAVGLSQTIDIANKRGASEQVGSANLQVAKAQRAVLRQQLIAEVLNALAGYQAAQQVVSLAKERVDLLQQFVKLTEKRLTSGDVARVDLDLAQLALSEGLAQQADAQVSASQALQTLKATTGLSRTAWPQLPISLPNFTLTRLNTEDLINHLPILKVLTDQYLSAKARIKLAQRERYPDPTVGIQGGEENTDGQRAGLISVSVSMPLFVRNTYRYEADAAHYDAIEAAMKRNDVVRQARAEIESTAERYQILYETLQQWQGISNKPLNDGMNLIERLWQAGEINATDYLVQLKQRVDSQIAGAGLRGRAWQAWVAWLKASGMIEIWVQIDKNFKDKT